MLRLNDIQMQLKSIGDAKFQKLCDQIMMMLGYRPHKFTGSVVGKDKTRPGTPDSVYFDENGEYIYVEMTTQENDLEKKIEDDFKKCVLKISKFESLHNKISKIIFFHNNINIEENELEDIRMKYNNIKLEVYGIEFLSNLLQCKFPEIAKNELGLRDDYETISQIPDREIERISKLIFKEKKTNDTIDIIKSNINELYNSAARIVNTNDAMITISEEDKNILKSIFDQLKAFEFCYKDKRDNDAMIYYHNLFVILSKSSIDRGLELYTSLPDFVKLNNETIHIFTSLLISKKKYSEAKTILEEKYFIQHNEDFLDNLVKTYYFMEMYNEVIQILSNKKKEEFDNYGFLASMYIFSKNEIKKYTEAELVKMNGGKFHKMPLFYSCTSYLLYLLDKRKKTYKTQFDKGISLLDEKNSFLISVMCEYSIKIGLGKNMIKYLLKIELTPLLENKLLILLSNENNFAYISDEKIEQLLSNCSNKSFDNNYLIAKITESKGKEIEAIKIYKKSFEITSNSHSLFQLVNLTLKNKEKLEEKYIYELKSLNTYNSMMLSAEAYKYIGKFNFSLECSFKAIHMSKSFSNEKNALFQFWNTFLMFDKEDKKMDYVKEDAVIILSNSKKNKIFLLDNDSALTKNHLLGATIIRTESEIGTELFHKKVGDILMIEEVEYCVKEILHKYVYVSQCAFKVIKNKEDTRMLVSNKNDIEKGLEQLKNELKKQQESINEMLEYYQNNINVPLSALLTKENSFKEYTELINTLLSDSERIFHSGEIIDVDLKKGFVIDHTSLIILALFDLLNILKTDKIYITKSLYNKFEYFYEKLFNAREETEKYVTLVENGKLSFTETFVKDKIEFWKKLKRLLDKCNIIDYEFEKDELLNDKTLGVLDKVQFDLIGLAKLKKIPYICDDLVIRKICYKYDVLQSNSITLVKKFSNDYLEYIKSLKKYISCNYIYTIDFNELTYISGKLFRNFTDENKKNFLSIVEALLKNKVSFNYYAPILTTRLKGLEKVQYTEINGDIYENLFATFYINEVGKLLIESNNNLGLNFFNKTSEVED